MWENIEVLVWRCTKKVIEAGIIMNYFFFVLLWKGNLPLKSGTDLSVLTGSVSAACHHTASVRKEHACTAVFQLINPLSFLWKWCLPLWSKVLLPKSCTCPLTAPSAKFPFHLEITAANIYKVHLLQF